MPTKKTPTKGGKKAPTKGAAKPAKTAPAKAAKKAPAKAAPRKAGSGKVTRKADGAKAAKPRGSNGAEAKAREKEVRAAAPAKAAVAAVARDGAATKSGATSRDGAKKGKGESQRKQVIPWAQRFKDDAPGPWTCPKCGALPQRAQPLYGEDERHHCPNLDCDSIVTLLSKEDLEPAEKRGSWPPQRNKNRAIPSAGGAPGIGAPAPPSNGGD